MKKRLFLLLFPSILYCQITSLDNVSLMKKGGICFRVDDNKPIYQYLQFGSLFDKYNFNFSFALNLGIDMTQTYIDGVKILQESGNEFMDHTPDHKTSWFLTKFDPIEYADIDGVDHIINENKICLEHADVDLTQSSFSGIADIDGKYIISHKNGAFSKIQPDEIYAYLSNLDTLVWIIEVNNLNKNDPDTLRFKDVWHEPFQLENLNDVNYYVFSYDYVHLSIEGFKVLANESVKLSYKYGLNRPTTWIQPGTAYPRARRSDLSQALGFGDTLGYTAGAVYIGASARTYNEFDPENDKKFGMQWGDFSDDTYTLKQCKRKIAEEIAKHKILVGHSHFYDLLGGWDGYYDRVDQLLQWCQENEIPVLTHSQMSDALYSNVSDPYCNIIPPLNCDRDDDGIPDGYEAKSSETDWELDKNLLVPECNDFSFSIDHKGGICFIEGLGGIEKNQNEFFIWAKGQTGNSIEVIFRWVGGEQTFMFSTENNEWQKYYLSQSINGNTKLFIPESISLIDFEVKCSKYSSGQINIGGMSLTKIRSDNMVFVNVKIALEGNYLNSENIIPTNFPVKQPYSVTPWNYSGNESITSLPSELIDWILVELRDKDNPSLVITTRAGLLLSSGNVVDIDGVSPLAFATDEDDYYIVVKHRNHLSVMSKNTVHLSP
ncbi:MAG: hypothetical protein H6611_09765 [Ignavibacteriales bacterium]|nr:hypothetical protein [Ignavibacteriales bacterium]